MGSHANIGQTLLNSIILLVGLGTLSSPYALLEAGWIGIIINCMVAMCYYRASYFMYICQKKDTQLLSYQDIAYKTLPKCGKLLMVILFYLETLGTLIGFIISIVDNLTYIFPDSHIHVGYLHLENRIFFTIVASFAILPTLWLKKLSSISFLSFSCLLCFVITLICLLIIGFSDVGFHEKITIINPSGVPLAIGIFAFSYGGIGVFPTVYTSMANEKLFPMVLITSFSIAIFCYSILGIIGLLMFGRLLKSQVTLNMPRHLIASRIAIWATVATPITKFSLLLSPVAMEIETWCFKSSNLDEPSILASFVSVVLRTFLLLITVLIASALPYFGYVIELVGSAMTIAICMTLPCVFYLRCHKQLPLTRARIFEVYGLIIISTVAGIFGTVQSFKGLIASKLKS